MVRDLEFDEFLKEACPPLDLVWRKYRRRAARRRVRERMDALGINNYGGYLRCLRDDREEAAAFPRRIRLTLSRFYREGERWEALAATALPFLLEDCALNTPLRAWSAGCCGGEEPYTLALLWSDALRDRYPEKTIAVAATDVDEPSLERARKAVYEFPSLREIPPPMRERWFREQGRLFKLDARIGDLVRFEKRDLFDGMKAGETDLVLCRYLVFTYYRGARRRAAVERLWEALRPGGLLMIGRKEGLTPEDRQLFEPWEERNGLFRKKKVGSSGAGE